MTLEEPQPEPTGDWLRCFVPLGTRQGESWTPIGSGVLLVDTPVVWLVTARSTLEAAGDDVILGWVEAEGGGTLVDLTTGRSDQGLAWIAHPELDLATCLFPVDPSWRIKAFPEARCLPAEQLEPLLRVCTLCAAYGVGPPTRRPAPLALEGSLAAVDGGAGQLTTTAPLLPRNAGAPLLVPLPSQAGGGVALGGIALRTLNVPEGFQSTAAPVRLATALPIGAALALVRSEQGKAQRRAATASGGEAAAGSS